MELLVWYICNNDKNPAVNGFLIVPAAVLLHEDPGLGLLLADGAAGAALLPRRHRHSAGAVRGLQQGTVRK